MRMSLIELGMFLWLSSGRLSGALLLPGETDKLKAPGSGDPWSCSMQLASPGPGAWREVVVRAPTPGAQEKG